MDETVRAEVKGHWNRAQEKLDVAETLLRSKKYNDVVSRAYYAVFHAAKAVLLTEGLTPHTHRKMIAKTEIMKSILQLKRRMPWTQSVKHGNFWQK